MLAPSDVDDHSTSSAAITAATNEENRKSAEPTHKDTVKEKEIELAKTVPPTTGPEGKGKCSGKVDGGGVVAEEEGLIRRNNVEVIVDVHKVQDSSEEVEESSVDDDDDDDDEDDGEKEENDKPKEAVVEESEVKEEKLISLGIEELPTSSHTPANSSSEIKPENEEVRLKTESEMEQKNQAEASVSQEIKNAAAESHKADGGNNNFINNKEGEVAEILNNLEKLKTPEPDEVENGIVRSSFVNFQLNENEGEEGEPLEEQSDDEEDDVIAAISSDAAAATNNLNGEAQAKLDETGDQSSRTTHRVVVCDLSGATGIAGLGSIGGGSTSNSELQKIREEQVRKWLVFEQENPSGAPPEDDETPLSPHSESTLESLSSGSIEADSLLADGVTTSTAAALPLQNGNGTTLAEEIVLNGVANGEGDAQHHHDENGELIEMVNGVDGVPRRVRFLTDQEGNLLISVFMSNSPNTPSEESSSMLSNGGGEIISTAGDGESMENPSLVVSPPSLDQSNFQDGPSAPPMEEDFEASPSSPPPEIQVQRQVHSNPMETVPAPVPVLEKASAPPQEQQHPSSQQQQQQPSAQEEDEGGNSSDETLSVSSCNSMIEIVPNKTGKENSVPPPPQDPSVIDVDENNNELKGNAASLELEAPILPISTACFQMPHDVINTPIEEVTEEETASTASSSQPPSFIVHEPMPHSDEGLNTPPMMEEDHQDDSLPSSAASSSTNQLVSKLPSIDENNNVVEDQPESIPSRSTSSSQQEIPELRPSGACSSSDDGDDERLIMTPPSEVPPPPRPAQAFLGGVLSNGSDPNGGAGDTQMLSLCIQEEHISAVALTIAKWESMSKAQSSENLNTAGTTTSSPAPGGNNNLHTPVTKTSSSPSPSKPIHKPLQVSLSAKPVQNMPQNQYQPQNPIHIQQIIINGSSSLQGDSSKNNKEASKVTSNNAVNNNNSHGPGFDGGEPIIVGKVPGWNCWGNKVGEPPSKSIHEQNSGASDQNGSVNIMNAPEEIIYAQPNHQAGSTMTSIRNPSAVLKTYPKPLSKGEIILWLKEGEIHRAGLLLSHGQSHHPHPPAPMPVVAGGGANNNGAPVLVSWFFGLISRQQAEKYLHGQPSGTFLVRISTRIWGYTLSYQAATGRTKHFLISATNPAVPQTIQAMMESAPSPPQTGKQQRMSPFLPQGRYAFIGTNMTPYGSLVSLIRHHSHAPITKLGGEKLLNACPGGPQVSGMELLFKS